MEQENYKVRAEELRKQIEYHSNRYYNMDDPEITDYEYDMMMQELKKLEKEHTGACDTGFSDTESRRNCKTYRGRVSAS